MANQFRVIEHVIEAQHIREYAAAVATNQEDALKLHIKQYAPIVPLEASDDDAITIIGAHANGFPKELYEPLWEEIAYRTTVNGFKIRNIWIADAAHQGKSGVINEQALGYDPSWFDHSRDLLHMVNHFRREMLRPIMGIGHSFGATQLVQLSLMHPRLLTSLVLLDPVIELGPTTQSDSNQSQKKAASYDVAYASTYRRDLWPSREEAVKAFAQSPFYQKWDPRVFNLWIEYGLRRLPTAIYPQVGDMNASLVTLTTTKHQEVWTFLRPNYEGHGVGGSLSRNRLTHPDIDPSSLALYPFYRPEPAAIYHRLPAVRPPVFYIMGELSNISTGAERRQKVQVTGIGPGGSGGEIEGKVQSITLSGIGHLVPMEAVVATAEHTSQYIGQIMTTWRESERASLKQREGKDRRTNLVVDDLWLERIGESPKARKAKARQKL